MGVGGQPEFSTWLCVMTKLLAKGTAIVSWRFLLSFHCFSGIVLSGFLTFNSADSIENKWLTNVRMS